VTTKIALSILKAAIWQDHWVDRSALLKAEPVAVTNAVKVFLFSLERNRTWLFFFVLIASKKLTTIFLVRKTLAMAR
jgi:hypothetical protein